MTEEQRTSTFDERRNAGRQKTSTWTARRCKFLPHRQLSHHFLASIAALETVERANTPVQFE